MAAEGSPLELENHPADGAAPGEAREYDEMERLLAAPAASSHELVKRLKAAIHAGLLPPGARILNERRLAELVKLSRSTVRSALSKLEQEGLLTRQVGRGTFVANSSAQKTVTDTLVAVLSPAHLLDFRLMLEPQLAEHLVLTASDEALNSILALVIESRKAETWLDTEYADAEFHRRLCCASGNPLLVEASRLMTLTRNQTAWLHLKQRRFSWERWQRYQNEHEQIIAALRSRDGRKAKQLLRDHLIGVRQRFLI